MMLNDVHIHRARLLQVFSTDAVHVANQHMRCEACVDGVFPTRICSDNERITRKNINNARVWCITTDENKCWRFCHIRSLRWHYPDQVDGSVAAATLSAHRACELPLVVVSEYRYSRAMSGSMKMNRAAGTASRIATSAWSMVRLTSAAERSGLKMAFAATKMASGPTCSVCM